MGGLSITKRLVGPHHGVVPGTRFEGTWECAWPNGQDSDRFQVAGNATVVAFTVADQRVPASAECALEEDTPGSTGLVDGSFAWGEPTYHPESVTLRADRVEKLGVRNSVVRVFGALQVTKAVTGPADRLVDRDRPFTGSVVCRYRGDMPVAATWSATLNAPAGIPGILVGSRCAVSENPAGAGGEPVTGDPSYRWLAAQHGEPAVIAAPEAGRDCRTG